MPPSRLLTRAAAPRLQPFPIVRKFAHKRYNSTRSRNVSTIAPVLTSAAANSSEQSLQTTRSNPKTQNGKGLQRLSTSSILRSVLLGLIFSSPSLSRPAFSILRLIANSNSGLLNPDLNPILRAVLKPLLYDHFCAGKGRAEVCKTRESIKRTGYAGVILCYGAETQVSASNGLQPTNACVEDVQIQRWRDGNLHTLGMAEEGDWLGIKMSGAGSKVAAALMGDMAVPQEFTDAMDEICRSARDRNCRLWIDAEQQVLQGGIDKCTIDLMRRYNRDGQSVVYNTLQAYLKASRTKLKYQLALADREGWTLSIKLVRGAYIDNDHRELIHDTKSDTDDSYNSIVRDMLSGTNLGIPEHRFPRTQLFLAGHNPESVAAAWDLIRTLSEQDKLRVLPDFGQLQGMGDELGCGLLQQCEDLEAEQGSKVAIPKVYKCLTWGSIRECMQYLFRRAVENRGGTDRMRDGLSAYKSELRRRTFG